MQITITILQQDKATTEINSSGCGSSNNNNNSDKSSRLAKLFSTGIIHFFEDYKHTNWWMQGNQPLRHNARPLRHTCRAIISERILKTGLSIYHIRLLRYFLDAHTANVHVGYVRQGGSLYHRKQRWRLPLAKRKQYNDD